jgi:hypothetical protein
MKTFEQLRMTDMEMKIHKHAAELTPEQKLANEEASKMPKSKKPIQKTFIGPGDVAKYGPQ